MEYRYLDRIYDSETGILRWADDIDNKIGRKTPGKVIGSDNGKGYLVLRIDNKLMMITRFIWFMVHGEWPKGQIDHINQNRSDNRLCNLRVVTQRINMTNRKNSSKTLGVRKDKNKYYARITIDKEQINLGSFLTEDEAIKAHRLKFDEVNKLEQMG